jgi:hypothetical protein
MVRPSDDHLSKFTQNDLTTWEHKMAQLSGVRFSGFSSQTDH